MSEKSNKPDRRCPGELYDISESICKGRQRVHYPKCPLCHYRVETIDGPSLLSEVDNVGKKDKEGKKRKVVKLSSIHDQSINARIFQDHNIRGIYPEELNEYTAEKIGVGTAMFLKGLKEVSNIVVARDVRPSSNSLANSLMKGIIKAGVDVIDIGAMSTDAIYFAVGHFDYDAGIMVTASNNSADYNGFKLCHEKAMPISIDTGLSKIYEIARQTRYAVPKQPGRIIKKELLYDYKKHILSFANNIRPLKVVVDAGNGMAAKTIPIIFEDLPCKIVQLYFKLDGTFPNHGPNPLNEKSLRDLQKKVKKTKSNLGVAFDGDADRCVFVDENGQVIGSDLITAVISKEFLQREKAGTIIYDLRSSWVVPEEIKKAGGVPYREKVGHSHINTTMREKDAIFGGGLSGQYYFKNNYYADSGIIALIEILNILSSKNVPMSNLIAPLKRYSSTGTISFEVKDKDKKMDQIAEHFNDDKIDYLDGITVEHKDWWFNVRQSTTEPFLRLNLEAKTKELMEQHKKKIIDIIEKT